MKFNTVNPVTEEIIGEYETMASDEIFEIAGKVNGAYKEWKRSSIEDRSKHLMNAARVLRKNKDGYARLMTLEMGKPMKESLAEIEKCAWLAEVYARNSQRWLSDTTVGAAEKPPLPVAGVVLSQPCAFLNVPSGHLGYFFSGPGAARQGNCSHKIRIQQVFYVNVIRYYCPECVLGITRLLQNLFNGQCTLGNLVGVLEYGHIPRRQGGKGEPEGLPEREVPGHDA